jgi:hypothetical protein
VIPPVIMNNDSKGVELVVELYIGDFDVLLALFLPLSSLAET